MRTAIDNSGFLNVCHNCGCVGFEPSLAFDFNSVAKTLEITDNTTYSAGDARKIVHILVSDKHGNHKSGNIPVGGTGVVTLGLSNSNRGDVMDLSEGINIICTVVSDKRCVADLSAYSVGLVTGSATGDLGNTDNEGDIDGE